MEALAGDAVAVAFGHIGPVLEVCGVCGNHHFRWGIRFASRLPGLLKSVVKLSRGLYRVADRRLGRASSNPLVSGAETSTQIDPNSFRWCPVPHGLSVPCGVRQ